ncbi:MAG: DUF1080 domain-containing protein [Akkermansiaceae bacterium]
MKLKKTLLPLLICLGAPIAMAEEKSDTDGFTPLFNGKTMDGWHNPYKWGKIKVVDGEIHLTGDKKFFVVTDKKYSNFIFEAQILLPEGKANSGFMFRAHEQPGKVFGYQSEVDGDPNRKWSGGLYDEGRRRWFISPIKGDKKSEAEFRKRAGDSFKRNDWNTYRITCKGDHITIAVNGVVTTDVKDSKDASGVIGIQHHGEKGKTYKFRNLRIKELK